MKKLLILLCLAMQTKAQTHLAATYFKEAETSARKISLWKLPLYGPMLFVDSETRQAYANQPDSAGLFKPEGGIYTGFMPKETMVANTAIHWGGRNWSVILWPLPADRNERINLLLHESFHRIQEQIGFPAKSPTADHLSTMSGRIWFLLELNALKSALEKPVTQRGKDLANALAFRAKRQQLFPNTFVNEQSLEMNEGLAEYTGAILGRNDLRQHLYKQIDTAGDRKSLIRSCAYLTGPVYGLLLQERAKHWTKHLKVHDSFTELISRYYGVSAAGTPDEIPYQGLAIRNAELQKETLRLKQVASYTETFTGKPVLSINLVKMSIMFNPNTLFDLGALGTVYPTGEIRDIWGYLKVSSGGMLLKDWHIVTVPIGDLPDLTARQLNGNGWTLELAAGWQLVKTDDVRYVLTRL